MIMEENFIPDPLTLQDLPFLPDVEELEPEELRLLLSRLEILYHQVDGEEPEEEDENGEESEAYDEWLEQLEEMDDLMDAIRDRLE